MINNKVIEFKQIFHVNNNLQVYKNQNYIFFFNITKYHLKLAYFY